MSEQIELAFAEAMAAKGYGFHLIPADGQWYSFEFPGETEKKGSAKLTAIEGVVRDWRQGLSPIYVWPVGESGVEVDEGLADRIAAAAAAKKAEQERVRIESLNLFVSLPPATADHPYLVRKKITDPRPLRLEGDALVVPIFNALSGEFQAIQRIKPDGGKLFLKGAVFAGGCVMPGCNRNLDDLTHHKQGTIVIAEGYATGAAIRASTPEYAVLAALSHTNLMAVGKAVRQRYPQAKIVYAADDETKKDPGRTDHPGIDSANAAARAVRGLVAIPGRGDFNDVFVHDGAKAVAEQIAVATEPPPEVEVEAGIKAGNSPVAAQVRVVSLNDFYAYMPMHNYIYVPTREHWPATSVNARLAPMPDGVDRNGHPKFISASAWIDRNRPVEQMTWAPGEDMLIRDKLIQDGGWIDHPRATVFNLYRAPKLAAGDPTKVQPWLDHLMFIYPEDHLHLIHWFAQRVQTPGIKINHGIVLGGVPGIGKDTALEPVRRSVGEYNYHSISPEQMLGRFNAFIKSVILVINEARDLGEINRYAFHEHTKPYLASPPPMLLCDEKNLREHYVINVCGVIITTNYKTGGMYLPGNDRRHYVAWSDRKKEDFADDYWNKLWRWYDQGGDANVAAYLKQVNLENFDPKAPPKKTAAFWAIVDSNRAPEDAELADVIEKLNSPKALTLDWLLAKSPNEEFTKLLTERKSRRGIPHRLEAVDYVPIRNDGNVRDGLWKVKDNWKAIYVRKELTKAEQLVAAANLIANPDPPF